MALCVAVAVAVAVSVSTRAAAHPQFALSTVNRYAKLIVTGSPRPEAGASKSSPLSVRLFYTLMVGDTPARALRERADRNLDGRLDAAEQAQLGAELFAAIRSGVRVERREHAADQAPGTAPGARSEPLVWELVPLALSSDRVGPLAFSLEASASFELPPTPLGQEQELRYEDGVALAPIGEVELRVEEGPGARVLDAVQGAGADPSEQSPPAGAGTEPAKAQKKSTPPPLVLQTYGPPRSSLSDRSIRVRLARSAFPAARLSPESQPTSWRSPTLRLLGLVFFVLGIAGLVVHRARPTRRASHRA